MAKTLRERCWRSVKNENEKRLCDDSQAMRTNIERVVVESKVVVSVKGELALAKRVEP